MMRRSGKAYLGRRSRIQSPRDSRSPQCDGCWSRKVFPDGACARPASCGGHGSSHPTADNRRFRQLKHPSGVQVYNTPDAIHLPRQDVTSTTTPGRLAVKVEDRFCLAEVEPGLRNREYLPTLVVGKAFNTVARGHMQVAVAQTTDSAPFGRRRFARMSVGTALVKTKLPRVTSDACGNRSC